MDKNLRMQIDRIKSIENGTYRVEKVMTIADITEENTDTPLARMLRAGFTQLPNGKWKDPITGKVNSCMSLWSTMIEREKQKG